MESNSLEPKKDAPVGTVVIESTREEKEVEASIVLARKFPRSRTTAINNIVDNCKRKNLADKAMYAYPRGGQVVRGPSIRLAEVVANEWGNISCGWKVLHTHYDTTEIKTFCWDLESNTRKEIVFSVKHERHTKKGMTKLKDPRDIYELCANNASRRLRNCIIAIIPPYVIEEAIEQCTKTLSGANDKPLVDRIRSMVKAFETFKVSKQDLEEFLKHPVDETTEYEIVDLQVIYNTLKDGAKSAGDFFSSKASKALAVDEVQDLLNKEPKKKTAKEPDKKEDLEKLPFE